MLRLTPLLLSLLASGCKAGAGGPSGAAALPAPAATRGYILISIDTLRADHLGCYGYGRPTSPFLDSLAQRATLFEEAYAQYPSTLVSHMSMLTGLYPREHGVFPPNSVVSPQVEMLPEVFQRAGFRTAGFTEGGYVSGRFGFRRGFDTFVSRERTHKRLIEQTFRRGTDFLGQLGPGDRFFLFLHTYAVHAPYDAPDEYQKLFWPGADPEGAFPPGGTVMTRKSLLGEVPPPAVLDWLTARYDAGIREADDVLRRFFADLERLGLRDAVTVIVTADHGEELQDHGRYNHTQLYRETMHVPLLVLHPEKRAAVRHAGVVQLIDLAPTLYALARLKGSGRVSGANLAGLVGHPSAALEGTAWTEASDGQRAVYRGERRALDSLLLFDPPPGNWLGRSVRLDAHAGRLAFEARAYGEARRLTVRQGDRILAQRDLSTEWSRLEFELPQAERLLLETDGCAAPEDGKVREPRCFGFEVRGSRLTRVELYDIDQDPRQRRDLSHERRGATRSLLTELIAWSPPPAGPVSAPPLDPALAESLRSLGYLQ